jgi:hypothetical protein
MEHDYKLKYDFNSEVGHFKAADIKAEGKGGTDGLVLISCIEAEDGSYSQTFVSKDGNDDGNEMSTEKLAKAWLMMGMSLLRREDMNDPRYIKAIEGARDALFGKKP